MKINPNAPANPIANSEGFPSYVETLNSGKPECIGLTIRQQFAMAAMQGILTAQAGTRKMVLMQAEYFAKYYPELNLFQAISCKSVKMADALIAELNRTEADNV